jgi:hypothetical protein
MSAGLGTPVVMRAAFGYRGPAAFQRAAVSSCGVELRT